MLTEITFCIFFGCLMGLPSVSDAEWVHGWRRLLVISSYAVVAFFTLYFWKAFYR